MRQGRRGRPVFCAYTLGLVVLFGATGQAMASVPDDYFGVNGQGVFYEPSDQWDAQLAAMAAGGLQVVRTDASWDSAEPRPPDASTGQHTYDWSKLDAEVAALSRHDLRWYPILDYSAPWAAQAPGDPFSAPARVSDYVAWAQALAERYGRGGSFWQDHPELSPLPVTAYEVWNEENSDHFWHPQAGAPEAYADLYAATRAVLHQVDPAARVVVGGLALVNTGVTDPSQFIQRMYAHRPDLRTGVDAVGFHPYALDATGVLGTVAAFRSTLDALGATSVPIEITEIGWTTANTSEAARAAALQRLAQVIPRSDCGVERFLPHTWVEPDSQGGSFGIFNEDATPKPSGTAYLNAVKSVRGSTAQFPSGKIRICHQNGPKLTLRVVKRAGEPQRVTVIAHCPSGCRLQVALLAPRRPSGGANRRVALRTIPFTKRRQSLRFVIPRRVRMQSHRVQLGVRAVDRAGRQTTRSRNIRIR
jgi:hypothetical protein